MKGMFHRPHARLCVFLAGAGLLFGSLALAAQSDHYRGRKYKAPPPSANIRVTVLKDYNGKPVPDAHVIFHPTEGDRDTGALEVKTNSDGLARIDVIPIGDTVTLQVIAKGYQTYGQSFKIEKSALSMEIRLKRPSGQYSIYTNPDSHGNPGNGGASGAGSSSSGSPKTSPPSAQPKP